MAKKKIIVREKYKQGVITNDKKRICEMVKKSFEIEVKEQTLFDDDSRSITLTIHYKE